MGSGVPSKHLCRVGFQCLFQEADDALDGGRERDSFCHRSKTIGSHSLGDGNKLAGKVGGCVSKAVNRFSTVVVKLLRPSMTIFCSGIVLCFIGIEVLLSLKAGVPRNHRPTLTIPRMTSM